MKWQDVGFDWNRARAFLLTAEEGSFSAAARALGVSQPTVGRQVAALEEELEVALFERIGSSLSLTRAGLSLLDHVRAMGEAAQRVSLQATGQAHSLEGSVSIASSDSVAAYVLPPVLRRLHRSYPGIELELVVGTGASDLLRREADVAIRHFAPEEPELVAKKVGEARTRMYATPGYLAEIGHPREAEDLSKAEFLGFDRTDRLIEILSGIGLALTQAHFPIVTINHAVQWELARQGLGICFAMEQIGDREPLVQRVVPDFPIMPIPVWLTAHREVRTSRRIRVVFDGLAEALGELID